jgi:UDP-N-acetylmuramate dehydrogenase
VSADLQQKLTQSLGERARFHQPMSAHTTWGVGGPAWCVCRVHSAEECTGVIREVERAGLPWMVLGRGSNLLVSDKGYAGVMLRLNGPLSSLRREHPDHLWAGGGAPLATAVKFAAQLGLAGLEWAAGIPGTVGGAVATNAGAWGSDMSRVAEDITLLLREGLVRRQRGAALPAGYRRRELPPGSLVLSARLRLAPDSPERVAERTQELQERRRQSQPGGRTAGSVFKNPPGQSAGALIEQAGCKGLSQGGAQVSQRHANFIVNRGGASAREVLALIGLVQERVREACGVELEPEVEVVGV